MTSYPATWTTEMKQEYDEQVADGESSCFHCFEEYYDGGAGMCITCRDDEGIDEGRVINPVAIHLNLPNGKVKVVKLQ